MNGIVVKPAVQVADVKRKIEAAFEQSASESTLDCPSMSL